MKTSLQLRMQHQPDSLTLLLYNLNEDQIRSRPIPYKWSIYENIVHLARYHEVFKDRIRQIIEATETPMFQRYKAEDDKGFYDWQRKSFIELMNDFSEDRRSLNNYLGSLSKEELQKTGRHPLYGLMNVEGWTELFLLHEAHHFFTIVKLAPQANPERVLGLYSNQNYSSFNFI
jgi:hypothetical protein